MTKVFICKGCNQEHKLGKSCMGKYCSNKCQANFEYTFYIQRWKSGLEKGWNSKIAQIAPRIRRYMLLKYEFACSKCGWNKRHPVDGLPLVEINHIDGNAKNCVEENLEVVCPNCHSETPNFRARNKSSERNRS